MTQIDKWNLVSNHQKREQPFVRFADVDTFGVAHVAERGAV